MNSIKVGDVLSIHCYKHNGRIYQTSDEATVIEVTDDLLVCGNFETKLTKEDGHSYKTNEPAVMFFYKKRWFNVIAQLKKRGLFYYCNIATPFLIEDKIIKYIDYDLDLRVFPDGGHRVLDKNEYNYHRKLMKYPEELDMIIQSELQSLIMMKKANEGPFNRQLVDYYYDKYRKMKKN